MAYEHSLDVATVGVEVWNKWRHDHPNILPDLSNVTLANTDLRQADFVNADLTRANLTEANLRGAILTNANLNAADLTRANLTETQIGSTLFVNNDFRTVKGLETVYHIKPSSIGVDTLSRSEGDIPEAFLRGAGLTDTFITYARSLVQSPIQYYTCFLSYSSQDQEFAERLYADLQRKGVRCWFAPHSLKIGDKFPLRIEESIRLYDKLLLLLSDYSVMSQWVEYEVMAALEKERIVGKTVLFPIRLDSSILTTTSGWTASLRRKRHIADFEQWRDHDKYLVALSRLIRDLKASEVTEVNGEGVD